MAEPDRNQSQGGAFPSRRLSAGDRDRAGRFRTISFVIRYFQNCLDGGRGKAGFPEEPGVFRINYLRRSSGSQQMPLTDFSAYAFSSLLFLAAHLPRSRFSCDSTPFKNLKAVLAIWSGSAARLSRPISIVRYPLYSHSFNACISPIQSTRPSPGITRPLSDTWTCTKSSRMVRT